ncbi:Glycosyl hydrolase family 43 protein [Pleurostoma richardsiae]|uniref:Glycosyl hydrolase family 43 protein n=1 Tax=Pleurostoma richardsiae TaxID=41990 RepID=A0AA38VRA7_9PEZI|nr:Glycosyl hydrolase family 43 protein [Pleurostoma richardsiae]
MLLINAISFALFANLAAATPAQVLNTDFPDPSILNDPKTGNWFAFATAGNGEKVQVASGPSATGPWTWQDTTNVLPDTGSWAVNTGIWAPDVRYLAASNSFVMYYAAPYAANTAFHCVGAALSSTITGPYTAINTPIACPTDQGGAIDPNGYFDEATNTRWLVYKIDGNAVGNGGSCGNTVAPIHSTPIMMQQLSLDGYTTIGSAFQILDRGDADGPLIEAPSLIKASDGSFVLFFSSNCYSTTLYDVSYATASSLTGPYTKSSAPLLVTGNYGLTAPGGATSIVGGGQLVFHANCDAGRCMYETSFSVANNIVTIT